MSWAVGLTTVRGREVLLKRTLKSLAIGGFANPRIFWDGVDPRDAPEWACQYPGTYRRDPLRTVGNWVLGLWELWVRNPTADLFAMFQDDFVTVRGLREYLETTHEPGREVYRNLYLFHSNESVKPAGLPNGRGWYESRVLGSTDNPGKFQTGRGAVALVFDRKAVEVLLSAPTLVRKPTDMRLAPDRTPRSGHAAAEQGRELAGGPWTWGQKKLDGAIVTAMNEANYRELVHYPSLTQHTGDRSSMFNLPHAKAPSFPGEEFDAAELLSRG